MVGLKKIPLNNYSVGKLGHKEFSYEIKHMCAHVYTHTHTGISSSSAGTSETLLTQMRVASDCIAWDNTRFGDLGYTITHRISQGGLSGFES